MTILIFLVGVLWLLICLAVVALAKTAARGDAQAAHECQPRFRREADVRPSSHERS